MSLLNRLGKILSISQSFTQEAEDARRIHNATIAAMDRVRAAAKRAVVDVENASNRLLFAQALSRYNQVLRTEAEGLESTTEASAPLVRELLQKCTLDLLP